MLPWKQRKPQISPVNQNLSSVYVSLAKFQLVSCNLSLAMVWQMTYTHQLSKLCSATITGYSTNTILILVNLFIFATLFLVIVLCAERFIAIHYYLRYQELVTHKRVVAVVVSIWVLSGLFSLVRLWIPASIMHVVFGIIQLACIIDATFFSIRIYSSVRLHLNQIQVLQLQHAPQNAQMVNVRRMRKFAIMSVYACLVLTVCYLPNICTLFLLPSLLDQALA